MLFYFERLTYHCIVVIANLTVEPCMSKTDARVVSGASQKLMATDKAAALDGLGVKTDYRTCRPQRAAFNRFNRASTAENYLIVTAQSPRTMPLCLKSLKLKAKERLRATDYPLDAPQISNTTVSHMLPYTHLDSFFCCQYVSLTSTIT